MAARRDPIELEIFKNLFHAIAEEMGAALRRTAFSPNIKERRDYSCAIFNAAGEVVAMGDHMPVHLGSMPMSVSAAIDECALNGDFLAPGDVVMLNDPFRGGTHLPDITLVAPVYILDRVAQEPVLSEVEGSTAVQPRRGETKRVRPDFFVASRAHHADVGGTWPGSMGLCEEIYQEGLRIPPVKLMRAGVMQRDILQLILANVRTPEEREGDLGAQLAACHTGAVRLAGLCSRYGLARVQGAMGELQDYAEEMMRAFLAKLPPGRYSAEDFLDDDGITPEPVRLRVAVTVHRGSTRNQPKVSADFAGSSPQVRGSINAVEAITWSACFYVFRCLLQEDVPAAAGLMRPIEVKVPLGSVLNSVPPAAVAGGNVETSQRTVDVLLRALAKTAPDRVPAAASGTMNNLTIGGVDDRAAFVGVGDSPAHGAKRRQALLKTQDSKLNTVFAYYETIAGGMGGRPTKDGVSGIHTHMTNSLNTPAEALEHAYPLRVTEYSIRRGSGGKGRHRGGDGIVREVELLADAQVTLLADRRKRGPYGLAGGKDGAVGHTIAVRKDGSREELPGKGSVRLNKGDRVRIETSGGGGWGRG